MRDTITISASEPRRVMPWRNPIIVICAMLLVSGFYAIALSKNQFVFDDHEVIEKLPRYVSFRDVLHMFVEPHYFSYLYYRPITRASFAIERAIFGLKPLAFHLFNAIEAGLVYAAVYLLLRSRQFLIQPVPAMLASAWLVLHPAFTECVYPAASGRESLMPMLFIALALWAYLRQGWRWYSLSMLFFAIALLCKEQSAVLPGLFVLADLLWIPRWRQKIIRWIPMVIVFGGYFLLRLFVFGGRTIHVDVMDHPEQPLISLLYGLQSTFTPFVALRYEPTIDVWLSWPLAIVSLLMLAILIYFVANSARPINRAAIFWLAWFVLLQLPTAHIVIEQEAPFSERYVALATLALPAVVAAIVSQFRSRQAMRFATAAASIWLVAFSFISFARAAFYRDDSSFFTQWILTNPQSAEAHSGMGLAYQSQGRLYKAIDEYTLALKYNPKDWTANLSLGVLLYNSGQYREAESHLRIVIEDGVDDPLGMIYYGMTLEMLSFQEKNDRLREDAKIFLEKAMALQPSNALAHFQMGIWLSQNGNVAKARSELQTALALDPDLAGAAKLLAQLNSVK